MKWEYRQVHIRKILHSLEPVCQGHDIQTLLFIIDYNTTLLGTLIMEPKILDLRLLKEERSVFTIKLCCENRI